MQSNDHNNAVAKIIHYHEETKHRYERYARSAGYMDWQNQPNPFRFYQDVPLIKLPLLKKNPAAQYAALYQRQDSQKQSFGLESIAGFLELSLDELWQEVAQIEDNERRQAAYEVLDRVIAVLEPEKVSRKRVAGARARVPETRH